MRNEIVCILQASLLVAVVSLGEDETRTAQITVRVRADDGAAVTGIVVGASTFWRHIPGEGFGRDEYKTVKEATDTNGVVKLSIPSLTGEIAYGVRPFAGFYENESERIRFTNSAAGKWQPWNPSVETVLKKKVNPIPMYAKKFQGERNKKLPEIGKPIGFDLMNGDWIAPYGTGETPDFVFRLDRQLGDMTPNGYQMFEATFTVTFSNEGDGIQSVYSDPRKGSALRLPRTAPEDGYSTNLVRRAYRHTDGCHVECREDQNYFFRVRTKKDDKGNIVSALYGKIHGEIDADLSRTNNSVVFTYYLNPTPNDRNLEFDPKRNLFKNLGTFERVEEP